VAGGHDGDHASAWQGGDGRHCGVSASPSYKAANKLSAVSSIHGDSDRRRRLQRAGPRQTRE
jgi:hypothetical protein